MHITFHGAAGGVTGSKHLITLDDGRKILLDCGLFQGRRAWAYQMNSMLPEELTTVDAVIISHAHIDHCGALPILVKRGYSGKIFCTPATADIAMLMLEDAARIQESDERFAVGHLGTSPIPKEPLYTEEDVKRVAPLFVRHLYHEPFTVVPGVVCTFYDAGHIFGSGSVRLEITEGQKIITVVFSGDVGRPGKNIINDPESPPSADILLVESTYGGRMHENTSDLREKLAAVLARTIAREGKVIIPSFSLQRTQELVYDLHVLQKEGRIPLVPIYIDSPLAARITEVYRNHRYVFDKQSYEDFFEDDLRPLTSPHIFYVNSPHHSRSIQRKNTPMIILSASGMCEAGRIRHHLVAGIENPKNTILFVGYQAEHTLGRKILEGQEIVRIFDQDYVVRAEVTKINGYSGHADHKELMDFVRGVSGLKHVFVIHGEPVPSAALAEDIKGVFKGIKITIPTLGDVVKIV